MKEACLWFWVGSIGSILFSFSMPYFSMIALNVYNVLTQKTSISDFLYIYYIQQNFVAGRYGFILCAMRSQSIHHSVIAVTWISNIAYCW